MHRIKHAAETPPKNLSLHDGETSELDVLSSKLWTLPKYVCSLGLWAIWRKRHHFLLTNERIILTQGIITKVERSVPLARIQDVSVIRSPFIGGHIALSSAGGDLGIRTIGPLTQSDAKVFGEALQRNVARTHGAGL